MTGGALGALIVSALKGPVWLQLAAFFVITGVLLFFTRPWAVKFLNRRRIETNVNSMVGRGVRVIERVENSHETGKVICNGMEWTARSAENDVIFEPEEVAEVVQVSGVKLILKRPSED